MDLPCVSNPFDNFVKWERPSFFIQVEKLMTVIRNSIPLRSVPSELVVVAANDYALLDKALQRRSDLTGGQVGVGFGHLGHALKHPEAAVMRTTSAPVILLDPEVDVLQD